MTYRGVVLRIERTLYSHSRHGNLVCQIDAAINPGSSGGPVISNGKLVGVIFQSTSGQNIGYMVPAPVVRHFQADLQDGRHDGVPVELKKYYNQYITADNQDRQEVVILMDVLPDELNVGYHMFKNKVIADVNGIQINRIQDLVAAFEAHSANHRIQFESHDIEIILSDDQLQEKGRSILAKYKVPADRSPDLKQ